MNQEMTGAEIVLQSLIDQGVEVVFGYPGGAVLPIYDTLFKQNSIKHVLVRQEGGAIHAAEGYARSTGKVGVVLVTSGPGATNVVTGLTDAMMDSIPIVCITGQVPQHLIGSDAFQECDTTGITRPCTKHNYLVKDPNKLSPVFHEAFTIAQDGRPGPVLIDIPKDVQFANGTYTKKENIIKFKIKLKLPFFKSLSLFTCREKSPKLIMIIEKYAKIVPATVRIGAILSELRKLLKSKIPINA